MAPRLRAGDFVYVDFHFRALNTGWKSPRRVVLVHADGHVRDERIAAMRAIVDSRHRQPDRDAVPYPALSGDSGSVT